ncbi:MAG: hypothetical protein Alis3KO_26700 [Aliiglaciecola sp.]
MTRLGLVIYALFAFSVNAAKSNSEPGAELQQAISNFELGELDKARKSFVEYSDNALAQTYLARLTMDEDLDVAEQWIEKAWQLDNQVAITAYFRGIIMGRQASDSIFSALSYAKKSLKSFEKAVELEPENIQYRMGLMQFHLSAPGIAGGDEDEAKSQLNAIQSMSDYHGTRALLSFHQQQENDGEYLLTLIEAIKTYPDLPDFYVEHGLYLQRNQQYDQAIALFVTAQQKMGVAENSERQRFMATYQIGRTAVLSEKYLQQGHDALVDYLQHSPKDRNLPDKQWATYRLAQILHLQEQHSDAKSLLGMLMKTNDKELVSRAKKLLKSLS